MSRLLVRVVLTVMTLAVFLPGTSNAEPLDPGSVPPELKPWIPWVLDEVGDEACTMVAGNRQCVWLGRITVSASATGARFELQVLTERRTKVPLPGTDKLWPDAVKAGNDTATVLAEGGKPYTILPAGAHTIEGRFTWRKLPEVLPLPAAVARVSLSVDDARVAAPRRTDDGGVWLGGEQDKGEDTTETDSLELSVTRRIQDAIPLRVTTRVELRVGGRPREVRLPAPLLAQSELLEMRAGALSARFEPGGVLVIEARSGNHTIELDARHGQAESLRLEKREAPWPADEVWVWSPDVALRHAEVSGGSAIDPAQTRLPPEWRKLSAFKLRAPATFQTKTVRRGQKEAPPNKLSLSRNVILDLDGDGYTVVDSITGSMHRDWRLAFAGTEQLGNVVAGAEGKDKLITVDGEHTAVELRTGRVDMAAVSRGDGAPSQLAAVGWQADVDRLSVDVHLPPGWELLWASGVDDVTPQRLARWELIDLLLVLGLALAIGKLCGWAWAPVAAIAFMLAHDAGHAAWWAWAPLCASVYLLRRVPEGRWREVLRAARIASASVLAYALVVFGAAQLQLLVYPQAVAEDVAERQMEDREAEPHTQAAADNKEGGTGTRAKGQEGSMGRPGRAPAATAVRALEESGTAGLLKRGAGGDPDAPTAPWGRDDSLGTDPLKAKKPEEAQQDPQAVIQTGPGVPRWKYTQHSLSWVGPVQQGHQIHLWLLSPLLRALLALLAVVLSGGVAVVLFRAHVEQQGRGGRRGTAGAVMFALLLTGLSAPARAQAPSKELLDELKSRLTRAPACAPECVTVSKLTAEATEDVLTLTAEVHAGAQAVYQLPGPASSWVPSVVEVDGKATRALATVDRYLYLRLSKGQHVVVLSGPLQSAELTLSLGTAPHRVVVDSDSWDIDGVDDDGQAEASIRFYRAVSGVPKDEKTPAAPKPESTQTPPWLEVTRLFDAGVKWTLHTRVRRVSAKDQPIVIKLPLLEGESVTEGGAKQSGREATVTLDRNATEVSFVSSLKQTAELTLTAAEGQPWSEVWSLRCSEVWHCTHEGIAPVVHMESDTWRPVFRPWPGESVSFTLHRPPAAEGRTLTVGYAALELDAQDRVTQAKLRLNVHASTGGAYTLRIPSGVRVESLRVGNRAQPVEGHGGEIKVALVPGRQPVEVTWQEPKGVATFYRAPEIVLGDQVVNAIVDISIPYDRWTVFARGPGMGPDVQLWGYLLLLIAVALGLSRIPESPLKPWQWVLLAVGLTQTPVALAIAAGAWFFLIAHRKRWKLQPRVHNAVQVLVVLWTVAFAFTVVGTMYMGLAERPEMMIVPRNGARALMSWYVDRTVGSMPRPWVLSTSMWAWRLVMAAWSAWVVVLLYKWSPTVWASFTAGGIWHRTPARAAAVAEKPFARAPSVEAPSADATPEPASDED